MPKRTGLDRARREKNDEFYTQYASIEKELSFYKKELAEKTVYLNCDSPYSSNFCKWFLLNFYKYKIKRLICTSCNKHTEAAFGGGRGYVLDVSSPPSFDSADLTELDVYIKAKTALLKGDGDFSSAECVSFLRQADVVVTNPPFSLFRRLIELLSENKKDFILLGNFNGVTYKNVYPLFKEGKLFFGATNTGGSMEFDVPLSCSEKGRAKVGSIAWFSTFKAEGAKTKVLELKEHFFDGEQAYKKYENLDGINCDRLKDIPVDYFPCLIYGRELLENKLPKEFIVIKKGFGFDGVKPFKAGAYYIYDTGRQAAVITLGQDASKVEEAVRAFYKDEPMERLSGAMGVPISFLKYLPDDRFEVMGFRKGDDGHDLFYKTKGGELHRPYFRVVIKRKGGL